MTLCVFGLKQIPTTEGTGEHGGKLDHRDDFHLLKVITLVSIT
jgi:hypothetical protein